MRSSSITISFLLAFTSSTFSAQAAIHYVDVNSTNPVTPYLSWDTAAVTIQDAENVCLIGNGDEILVTNGVYHTGGTSGSRVSIFRAKYVHSINGPDVTIIQGYQPPGTTNGTGSIRCVSANATTIAGFTVLNGAASDYGGGLFSGPASAPATASNCVFVGNVAAFGGGAYGAELVNCRILSNTARNNGGGCSFSRLINCVLSNNTAGALGGGAYNCGLTNCLVLGNSASKGGGAYGDQYYVYTVNCTVISNSAATAGGVWFTYPPGVAVTVLNDILYWNSATIDPDFHGDNISGTPVNLAWCCLPTGFGDHSISNSPLFMDATHNDFRLSPNSPCINAGRNSYVISGTDLDGNPRIAGGTVDIGAYEFQNPQSVISYGWLQNHSLPTDGSADYADADGDSMNNWQEWVTNTDPTNSLSYLQMLTPDGTNNATGVTIHWQSAGIRYFLQRSTNLTGPFDTFATNFYAGVGIATYRNASATNTGPYFYRVGVQP